jgi:hypothetical protein
MNMEYLIFPLIARLAEWYEWRRKDLMILASRVRVLLWDVGAGPSDETVKARSSVTAGVARKRTFIVKSHDCKAYV